MKRRRHFRLQRILDVRELVEKEKQKEFSVAMSKLRRHEQQLESLAEKKDDFAHSMNPTGKSTVRNLSEHHGFLRSLKDSIAEQQMVINDASKEVEGRRVELLQASQDRKALEKLREKKIEEIVQIENSNEQKFLDEIAMYKRTYLTE